MIFQYFAFRDSVEKTFKNSKKILFQTVGKKKASLNLIVTYISVLVFLNREILTFKTSRVSTKKIVTFVHFCLKPKIALKEKEKEKEEEKKERNKERIKN